MSDRKSPSGPLSDIYLTQTVTPGATVTANQANEISVTVTGATVGDVVNWSARTALQNGLLNNGGRVSAADTVILSLANATETAISATAFTANISVNKGTTP